MKKIVLHNQSLLDLCLQHTGSIAGVFELAQANGLSITDDLEAGNALEVADSLIKDKDILSYYTAKNIQPATAWVETATMQGISYWTINVDFVVR